ncbi:hypothetical protein Bca52824_014901 [Brassica carinata]|uniref:Reverse transcriptase zinc-binding domain-containing protein n=1 Tax=Brassica carinata TaxID=52824 RepID=A0A8X7W3X0_BRACI|nr:hypothetical protein Bca52824_014901 [Brassica carinata]
MATLQPFLERITSKLHSWTVKTLSFAGKVRLLASVIYGMVNFWSSVFALPKRFYEKVDSLCCAFLWKNRASSGSGACISWESICKPKKEGGLGLRRLEEFEKSGSLWVAWLQANVFARRCYWAVLDSQRLSPTVKDMIRIKETVAGFLRCSIGDGRAASFWFDFWTDLGPLIEAFGHRGPRELQIRLDATVAEATANGEWSLPPARSDVAETLQIVLSTMAPPTPDRGVDRYLWLIPSPPLSLQDVAGFISTQRVTSSGSLSAVIKLLTQCIIYCIWRERNFRIFQYTSTTEAGVIVRVDRLMRDRLISLSPSSDSSPSPLLVYFRLPPPDP